MSYQSAFFLFIFLPLAVLGYALTPKRFRWLELLIASTIFYVATSFLLYTVVFVSALFTYLSGLYLDYLGKKDAKTPTLRRFLVGAIVLLLSVIAGLKYLKFILTMVNGLLLMLTSYRFPYFFYIGVPLGISFYTLQAISYLIDISRKKYPAQRNFGKLLLYLTFFPTIIEGPIARYDEISKDLFAGHALTLNAIRSGLIRLVWGIMKKMVIADRLSMFVVRIFNTSATSNPGSIIACGAIAFTIQLYMDFSGMIDASLGLGEMFGITLPENFQQPFAAKTVAEFWKRWHITLGAWFKDYLFYPVLLAAPIKKLNKKLRKRGFKHTALVLTNAIALFAVWLANGLWHGSGLQYVTFGMYYFILLTLATLCEPHIERVCSTLHINRTSLFYRILQTFKMVIIIVLGELIFRSTDLDYAFALIQGIFTNLQIDALWSGSLLRLGLDLPDWGVALIMLGIVGLVNTGKEHGFSTRQAFLKTSPYLQWTLIACISLIIFIFGAYGEGYSTVAVLYGGF